MSISVKTSNERLIVLTFHGIGDVPRRLDPGEDQFWLTREAFLRFADAIAPDQPIELTFDDGNMSDIEVVMPALLQRERRATFFVLAGRIGLPGALGAADIRALCQNGMQIGSHGMQHRSWFGMDHRVAREEIFEAKDRLEQLLGQPVTSAACPFGTYDRYSLDQLRKANFKVVYTSDPGIARPTQWLRRRNTVRAGDDWFALQRRLARESFWGIFWARSAKQFIKSRR